MLFKQEHIPMILSGTKTATRRKSIRVKVGHIYSVKTKMLSKETHCFIEVTKIYSQPLSEMKQEDYEKEGYKDYISFRNIWEKINGEWIPNYLVWVIEFKLVKDKSSEEKKNG